MLHSFSKCSFTLSKLRFFELRAPKISSCYTTSRLLVTGFAHRLEFSRALYLHHYNNKVEGVAGVCKLRLKLALLYNFAATGHGFCLSARI